VYNGADEKQRQRNQQLANEPESGRQDGKGENNNPLTWIVRSARGKTIRGRKRDV